MFQQSTSQFAVTLLKSPILHNRDEFAAWIKERFPNDEFVCPSEMSYLCVIVAAQGPSSTFCGSEIVRYNEFQADRYRVDEDSKKTDYNTFP